ncbi:helix-turn-helix domain-containing protein [Nocardioides sp. Bht2]|uniref:helix-turn-helix domain-containing protein n=1 Tax=Nocardioides sp. Bht2 TaxID=3392297 RepID=UPI0039B542C4
MSSPRHSVAEAAKLLGVHPQRIHQRIRGGSLRAEKIGHQWVIESYELRRLRSYPPAGRPLSPRSAWAILAVSSDDAEAVAALSAPERSRARARLRALLAQGAAVSAPDDLARAASALRHALGKRASRHLLVAAPPDLPDLRNEARIHLAGVSRSASNLSAADLVEGYVESADLSALESAYLLSPGSPERTNVILHIVADRSPSEIARISRSPLGLAADLAEHDGVREHREAVRLLTELCGRQR